MLNTDIFNFEFVNRDEERKVLNDYLLEWSGNTYTLWMNGKRGVGKSYLITEHIVKKNDFVSVYVNVKMDVNTPGWYLQSFINELNKIADLTFLKYIQTNYKSISVVGQTALKAVLSIMDLDDIGLCELTSAITSHFITKQGETENSVSVVKKYISEILKKHNKIVFIFDNFSQCDFISLESMISIVHDLYLDNHIKFILCTTDEDLGTKTEIKSALAEKIPNKQLFIAPLKQKHLFARMIEHNFDIEEEEIKLLSQGFELCSGFPQKFKEMLINLYTTQGIIINDAKARFSTDIFRQLLIKNVLSFDIDSLCEEQKGAKKILQILTIWGAPIKSDIFYEFIEFYADIDLVPVLKEEVKQTVSVLENMHIISRVYEDKMLMFYFEHDSLRVSVNEYFKQDCSTNFLHYNIYEFLMLRKDYSYNPYWRKYYDRLCAYHSFVSQADNWININYDYAYKFYESEVYNESEIIISRLESVFASLNSHQLLTIGIVYFKCGRYGKASDVFSYIQSKDITALFSLEQATMLYIFFARTYSCLLDSEKALSIISKAEKISQNKNELYVEVLGAKQSILYLTPGKYEEAKKLFDLLVNEKSESRNMITVYQSAMDYYEGEKSIELLNRGLNISKKYSDYNSQGKFLNNIAFEYLRYGKYEKSKNLFNDSIELLKERQPHEQTYPYSNLAVLNMIAGEWDKALDNIMEALFWNKSDYASIVLKTNRMLCYFFIKDNQWERLSAELLKYIEKSPVVDDKIYKKICINLALIAYKSGNYSDGKKILMLCKNHLDNESELGKYRFFDLYEQLTGKKNMALIPEKSDCKKYYCEIEFEPWLINFSHE